MTSTRPQVIEGVYQKGVIKLLDKVGLRENERVRMQILHGEPQKTPPEGEVISLRGIWKGARISDESIEEAKHIWERGIEKQIG
ncbi:antitoxin family protein [Dehalococcoidia bacterium]|nr:antitoxin family protein [Dehalococcoidia bacterium]MCL0087892.1 antitoxin family protein [Dehalococcoidia bacterium]MCL0097850.1 antitoxin family protein [Dehalococcoidia bacterium]